MVYHAKTQQRLLFFFLIILISSQSFSSYTFAYFLYALVAIILFSFFIHYIFRFNADHLIYQINLFSIPIYKRILKPQEIAYITFKEFGFLRTSRGAIIKVQKGFNIRIIFFTPDSVLDDLIRFAKERGISTTIKF